MTKTKQEEPAVRGLGASSVDIRLKLHTGTLTVAMLP